MSYQLWLAERAVHGAVLRAVRGDVAAGQLAESILDAYAEAYSTYPNRDNVLGPTRLFFSTYLESIWLLQICVAIDLLESVGDQATRGARVRERIIEPSSALIRSYDEGASNRQVWNNAALLASAALLGGFGDTEGLVWGRSGVVSHLAQGLLSDGTWYEGENYHLFAHRGLWYGVQMAERLDLGLAEPFVAPFVARFEAGFAASFISALPDLTLPSRRDSQYAISLRQWRFAELCELGLARSDDPRVSAMLARLYAPDIPRAQVGRAQSTAEVERNLPPSALTRADLGWRSLLLAPAGVPAARQDPPGSVLLEGQGLAILRRGGGEVHVALDYGHSGGGHGHPDRLNLQLAHGPVRWLDDMGTGSYVDPTLHWYRSTLAHNAPLVDGRSQVRVHGSLLAFADDGEFGWVDAQADGIAPGTSARRTLVATPTYLVDVLEWTTASIAVVDLPIHLDADCVGDLEWTSAPLTGGDGIEDGFQFVTNSARAANGGPNVLHLRGERQGRSIRSWTSAANDPEWWCGSAPGAPGHPPARFYIARCRGSHGIVRSLLDWSASVRAVRFGSDEIVVERGDGGTDVHRRHGDAWRVDVASPGSTRTIGLGGGRTRAVASPAPAQSMSARRDAPEPLVVPAFRSGAPVTDQRALTIALGESHYRRSELAWRDAGQPEAVISLVAVDNLLQVAIEVRKTSPVNFATGRAVNELDNEDPDINSDGVQIHFAEIDGSAPVRTWLLVPVHDSAAVRTRNPAEGPRLGATWARSGRGYVIRCALPLTSAMARDGFALDIVVNEMSPDRERRRGQLVLSGSPGEWVYLRGDRQPRGALRHFALEAVRPSSQSSRDR